MKNPAVYLTRHYWRVKIRKLRWGRYRPAARYSWPGSLFSATHEISRLGEAEAGALPLVRARPSPDLNGEFSCGLYGLGGEKRTLSFRAEKSPDLALLRLKNVLCIKRFGIFTLEDKLLPHTSHIFSDESPDSAGAEPARLPPRLVAEIAREGIDEAEHPCFFLDCNCSGQYGHFITGAISRLWAYRPEDALPCLTAFSPAQSYVEELARPFGVRPQAIRHFKRAIFCRELYWPTVSNTLSRLPHPAAASVWQRIAEYYAARRSTPPPPEKIYFSRRNFTRNGRVLKQEKKVEDLFRKLGFQVVRPEALPCAGQIRLIAHSRLLAGTYGSAMHNTVFSLNRPRVFVITPFIELNYPVIDCAAGRDFTWYLGNREGHPVNMNEEPHFESWEIADWGDFERSVRTWAQE